jgi:hypothetical protein
MMSYAKCTCNLASARVRMPRCGCQDVGAKYMKDAWDARQGWHTTGWAIPGST